MKTNRTSFILIACCALFAAGCRQKTSNAKSDLTASSGGRDIHVSAEGAAWVGPQENQFTVKVTGHEIVIGTAQVLVNKKASAKVPAGAKKFEVNFGGGTLTVGADGAEILKTPLK
ncbi:MAG: hypothetical protein ABI318_05770 [Chthoniobacteraceae bacterium]